MKGTRPLALLTLVSTAYRLPTESGSATPPARWRPNTHPTSLEMSRAPNAPKTDRRGLGWCRSAGSRVDPALSGE